MPEAKLTPRETQIVALICEQGLSDPQIARALGLSPGTVKVFNTRIFEKLGFGTKGTDSMTPHGRNALMPWYWKQRVAEAQQCHG